MGSGNLFETVWKQETSIREMILEGKRDMALYHRVLQGIIADDEIIVRPKPATGAGESKIFHVLGSFDSVAQAIEAGNYPVKRGYAEKPEGIPVIIQPVDCLVRPVPLGRFTRADQMFLLYPRLVDPLTCLTFGARFRKEQETATIITLWKYKNELWSVYLGVGARQRYVSVLRVPPDYVFDGRCRVLVREFSPPQAEK